jgi:hypothetical protein
LTPCPLFTAWLDILVVSLVLLLLGSFQALLLLPWGSSALRLFVRRMLHLTWCFVLTWIIMPELSLIYNHGCHGEKCGSLVSVCVCPFILTHSRHQEFLNVYCSGQGDCWLVPGSREETSRQLHRFARIFGVPCSWWWHWFWLGFSAPGAPLSRLWKEIKTWLHYLSISPGLSLCGISSFVIQ